MKQTNTTRYEVALVFTFVPECYFSFDTAISHWVGHVLVAFLLLEGLGIVLFILLGVLPLVYLSVVYYSTIGQLSIPRLDISP